MDDKAELSRLEALRKKRVGKPGWAANVRAIDMQIAELKTKALING